MRMIVEGGNFEGGGRGRMEGCASVAQSVILK